VIQIILRPTKLIYLVRNELILIRLKPCSLSRRIGFPDRVRIIEFGSKVRKAVLQYLVVGFWGLKEKVTCHNVQFSKSVGYNR
jgi:hypothetical protein